ncbi:MAG TPA: hypothetical protein VFM97_06745 [Gammaproteobacteria bacterium]|nr:hypothetical protein [Gammaproteobacteria bacterium]
MGVITDFAGACDALKWGIYLDHGGFIMRLSALNACLFATMSVTAVAAVPPQLGPQIATPPIQSTINPQAFAKEAAAALEHNAPPGKRIPPRYINRASCIAVFPNFVAGGNASGQSLNQSNQGLTRSINNARTSLGLKACRRNNGQWQLSSPVFVTIRHLNTPVTPGSNDLAGLHKRPAANRGPQRAPSDLIVLFIVPGANQATARPPSTIGKKPPKVGVVPPASGSSPIIVQAWISNPGAGWSRQDIADANISTNGIAATENRQIYGQNVLPQEALKGIVPTSGNAVSLKPFTQALAQFAPASKYTAAQLNLHRLEHP